MDIKTFLEIVPTLDPNISILIRGRHGIGKSDLVRKISEVLNLPVIDRRIGQMTEGDAIGLPRSVERKRPNGDTVFATRFMQLDWFLDAVD